MGAVQSSTGEQATRSAPMQRSDTANENASQSFWKEGVHAFNCYGVLWPSVTKRAPHAAAHEHDVTAAR